MDNKTVIWYNLYMYKLLQIKPLLDIYKDIKQWECLSFFPVLYIAGLPGPIQAFIIVLMQKVKLDLLKP